MFLELFSNERGAKLRERLRTLQATADAVSRLDLLIKEIHFPTPERRGSKLSRRPRRAARGRGG